MRLSNNKFDINSATDIYQISFTLVSKDGVSINRANSLYSGKSVIIKCLKKNALNPLKDELFAKTDSLKHISLPSFIERFENDKFYYIVYEDINGITLAEFIKFNPNIDEYRISNILRQVCSCLDYLHHNNISFLDLNTKTIYIGKDDHVMLLSPIFDGKHDSIKYVTEFTNEYTYAPPEYFENNKIVPACADMWALGVVSYILAFSRPPFGVNQTYEKAKLALNEDMFKTKNISAKFDNFIERLLERDSSIRMTASQAINHDFIMGIATSSSIRTSLFHSSMIPLQQRLGKAKIGERSFPITSYERISSFNLKNSFLSGSDFLVGNLR